MIGNVLDRRGDEMGRHSAPDVVVAAPAPRGLPERVSEGDRWLVEGALKQWRGATAKARLQVAACVAVPVVGLIIAGAAHSSTPTEDPTASASQAGAAYGEQMRSEGYNGMSIELWCGTGSGGYSGTQMQAYQSACFEIGMQLSQQGG